MDEGGGNEGISATQPLQTHLANSYKHGRYKFTVGFQDAFQRKPKGKIPAQSLPGRELVSCS